MSKDKTDNKDQLKKSFKNQKKVLIQKKKK